MPTKLTEQDLNVLLPTTGWQGAVGDVLTHSSPRQGYRSAIANALAQASGDKDALEDANSFLIKYPFLSAMGGTVIPALLGGTIGYNVAGDDPNNQLMGAIGGAALSALLGGATTALMRRKKIKNIKNRVINKLLSADKVDTLKSFSPLGELYNADIKGLRKILQYKQKNKPVTEEDYDNAFGNNDLGSTLVEVGTRIPYAGAAAAPLYVAGKLLTHPQY